VRYCLQLQPPRSDTNAANGEEAVEIEDQTLSTRKSGVFLQQAIS
jgi:hypothetical protein